MADEGDECDGSRQGMFGVAWCGRRLKDGRRAGVRRSRMSRGGVLCEGSELVFEAEIVFWVERRRTFPKTDASEPGSMSVSWRKTGVRAVSFVVIEVLI